MPKVAIIGAGIAGLVCAKKLGSDFQVQLFEKSRGVAGRMATRRVADHGLEFDHGAQYFTIRSKEVRRLLEDWLDDKVVAPWRGSVVVLRPGLREEREKTPRFVAVPGMSALGKHLARYLSVETNVRIASAQRGKQGWMLTDDGGKTSGPFDILIVTAPPEQAHAILGPQSPLQSKLADVKLDPCWATLVHFAEMLPVPYDAGFVHGNPLRWICRNNSKPGRNMEKECWVLHASPEWSTANLEQSPEEITPRLLESLRQAVGQPLPEIRYATSHRWRYSAPADPLPDQYLWDETTKLGTCGDWCAGPRVEGAILSGLALARRLAES